MCLAIVAIAAHPQWPLVIAANRDEFHARPTQPAAPWPDAPQILAGRDLQGGGTWLGVTTQGRVALLTNVREPQRHRPDAPTRGQLVEQFLRSTVSARDYAAKLSIISHDFNGYNLIIGDQDGLWYCSNRVPGPGVALGAGVVGVSNAGLDTPWPKLTRARNAVAAHLAARHAPDPQALLEILADRTRPPDCELPDTGVGLAAEQLLSSPFIADDRYGTRSSTLVLLGTDGALRVVERQYQPGGAPLAERAWTHWVGSPQPSLASAWPWEAQERGGGDR